MREVSHRRAPDGNLARARARWCARVARLLLALAPAIVLAACSGKDPYDPGTPIGTYHVVGKLQTSTCGAGLGAADPWEFDIHLAVDPGRLYWVQGGPAVGGAMDAASHATLASSDTRTLQEADPKHGVPFCSVTRDDALDVRLAADETSFTATMKYTFTPTDGSDCSAQLATAGGPFDALPCTAQYQLSGTRTALPPTKK